MTTPTITPDPDTTRPNTRTSAAEVKPGDDVTVFAFEQDGNSHGFRSGWVRTVEPADPFRGQETLRFTLTTGERFDTIRYAVAHVYEPHDARQCDCPEFEQDEDENYTHNCCKTCGRTIFDGGTDGWQHTDHPDNDPEFEGYWTEGNPSPFASDEDEDDGEQAYGEVTTPTGAEVHVTGYWHKPTDETPGYVVLDVYTPESDDADPTPLKITVNDGPAYWQGGAPLRTAADLIRAWRASAAEIAPDGVAALDPDSAEGVEVATWLLAADELAAALGISGA